MSESPYAGSSIPIDTFVEQFRGDMIPLNKSFSYFPVVPIEESELRHLVFDPVTALPPKVNEIVADLRVVLAPYLDVGETKPKAAGGVSQNGSGAHAADRPESIVFQQPADKRRVAAVRLEREGSTYLFLAIRDEDVSDYHYFFYSELAAVLATKMDPELARKYSDLLREELEIEAHGEIDEKSWRLKERLLRKPLNPKGNSKALESYFRQSLEDSATLYLHGLCCDIDVESGPRQLASRYIRRRLNVLREMLPPPEGVPLFPEEISETV